MKLDLFGKPCNSEKIIINEGEKLLNILVIDCGIKNSQLRDLLKYNIQLTVVDTKYNFVHEVSRGVYDGIFISNGPGNPETSVEVVNQLRQIFSCENPYTSIWYLLGGHQLIGLASGGSIKRMKYGNRGHNIPCNLVEQTNVILLHKITDLRFY